MMLCYLFYGIYKFCFDVSTNLITENRPNERVMLIKRCACFVLLLDIIQLFKFYDASAY